MIWAFLGLNLMTAITFRVFKTSQYKDLIAQGDFSGFEVMSLLTLN
ncbi:hypothetical protein swp_2539 [Shewanella piezotolerans WP3]|uniref:Uncharacterized protein n=1 Tax=Shewanella piezotolerans (strain WP3 / JCM 13877) TaxID=225849 RepID=B8CP34_SHEPW|nr:hypothetical protein swp_2539 [Shewanella piezotolerans WP3]